jgi:short-subunit dehydrogenase
MGTALITGASSGLGVEFAWQLATLGHNLVLVARDQGQLEALAVKLRAAAGVQVEVLPADLAKRKDVALVAARLSKAEQPVGLLINNAGFGTRGGFLEAGLKQRKAELDVMVTAVMELSYAAAQAMVARGRGAILNVSSIAAYTTGGTYSAAKAWVKTFSESLAAELADSGVTVTALILGLTRTEFHARAGLDYRRYPKVAWLSPADAVARALIDVRRGAVLSTPSLRYGIVGQVARVMPRWLMRLITAPENR